MTDDKPEPRIVQGAIEIRADELIARIAGQPSSNERIADLERQLAERDALLDQYRNLLFEMSDAASAAAETMAMIIENCVKPD